MSDTGLKRSRQLLNEALLCTKAEDVPGQWLSIKPLITEWWSAYKRWEAQDTFKDAYVEGRMTVRSFKSTFETEVHKQIPRGTLKTPVEKFFADSQRNPLSQNEGMRHLTAFEAPSEHQKYWQDRGLDSSAFAKPSNFISREVKYAHGLHDLSASLIKPGKPLDKQLFSAGDGVHLSFVPLSKEEDQLLMWKLTGLAKRLQGLVPDFYSLVRGYRAKMTRIKLARDYDIGTGFTVTPVANPGNGPQYKLKYGVGTTVKVKGVIAPKQISVEEQMRLQGSLQQDQMKFRQILQTVSMDKKQVTEIVIALREHNGPFPVYAVLDQTRRVCDCFEIVGGQKRLNGRTISIEDGTLRSRAASRDG